MPLNVAGKKLIIFAGKGGVGKTTCSSATALHVSKTGKKTLVVTVDPAKRLKDSLGLEVGASEAQVAPNLYAMMFDPRTVIEEYLAKSHPDQKEKVVKHPLFKYVTNNLPGLNELLAIGKLVDLQDQGTYEVIVVDTAPTGHALTFLSAPQQVKELFEEQSLVHVALRFYRIYRRLKKASKGLLGWLKSEEVEDVPEVDFEALFKQVAAEATRISNMLTDHDRTVLNIVTIPEKLPVEESIELHEKVANQLKINVGAVIVNKVQPDSLQDLWGDFQRLREDEPTKEHLKREVAKRGYRAEMWGKVVQTVEFAALRRQMNMRYLDQLRKAIPVPIVEVPLHREDVSGLASLEEFRALLFSG